jgi:hypothetical protein
MSTTQSVWECRVCGRRVPRRVEECFCGARREQMLTLQQREAERSGRSIPFAVVLPLLLIGLVGAYALHVATRDDLDPSGASPPSPAASEPARVLRGATPAATPAGVANDVGPSPARPAPAALNWPSRDAAPATPEPTLAPLVQAAPAASPPDADQREQAKAAALEAYESELLRLAAPAARMMERVRVYRAECVGQHLNKITNCGDLEVSIRRTLTDLENGLEAAEDQARRSWLEPGRLREARSRTFFGSPEWEDLLRAARQLRP